MAEGDKWQDVEYLNHTSLKTYMPYMMGGGYALSSDLVHVILGINQQVRAPFFITPLPQEVFISPERLGSKSTDQSGNVEKRHKLPRAPGPSPPAPQLLPLRHAAPPSTSRLDWSSRTPSCRWTKAGWTLKRYYS